MEADSRKDRMEVPDLLWDLARDLICPHWVFIRLLTETKVKPSKHKWKGDPKPQAQQCHHGGERHLKAKEGACRECLTLNNIYPFELSHP